MQTPDHPIALTNILADVCTARGMELPPMSKRRTADERGRCPDGAIVAGADADISRAQDRAKP